MPSLAAVFRSPSNRPCPAAPKVLLGGLVLVAINVLLALPSLDNGFSLDDYNWLERTAFRESTREFLLASEPGQIFNPVGRAFFLALHTVAGHEPSPYRLAVLLLHCLCVLLVFELARRLLAGAVTGFVAAFLFSCQTSYDEAQFWIAAFFHPLNAVLCLGTLVALLGYLERRRARALIAALASFTGGLLTKATTFALPAVLPFLIPADPAAARRGPAARTLAVFFATWAAALALNLAVGLGSSYLVERGYYSIGPHLGTNLLSYLVWMLLPFGALAERVGLGGLSDGLVLAGGLVAAGALAAALVRGGSGTRFFVLLTLATLAPFLPFTFAPASRYTYLPAAGLAALLAHGSLRIFDRLRSPGAARLGALALAGCLAVSYADGRLRDNHYEYRERQMVAWVEDVVTAVPVLPPDRTITIVDLPVLAIDPGIHFEAALRLAYNEPALRLDLVAAGDSSPPDALVYDEGRLTPIR